MTDSILKPHLERLLLNRESPKTICPSEVARGLSTSELKELGVTNWRDLMPVIRDLLWTKRVAGEVEILQHGEVLENINSIEDIKGPIRARRKQ